MLILFSHILSMLDVSAVIADAGRPEAGEAMSIDCEYKIFDGSSIQGIEGTRPLLDCEVSRRVSLHRPATVFICKDQGPSHVMESAQSDGSSHPARRGKINISNEARQLSPNVFAGIAEGMSDTACRGLMPSLRYIRTRKSQS